MQLVVDLTIRLEALPTATPVYCPYESDSGQLKVIVYQYQAASRDKSTSQKMRAFGNDECSAEATVGTDVKSYSKRETTIVRYYTLLRYETPDSRSSHTDTLNH